MIAPLPTRPSLAHTRLLGALLGALLAGALAMGGLLLAAPPAAAASEDGCIDAGGVAVVVDFTELGGAVEVGCATSDPDSGRAALESAGFHPADSQPGLLCAIDSLPDPCPKTFQGSFWSYWHSTPDGEWTSYQVGADASHPVPGTLEGWRYNDGTTGPGIAPADVRQPSATVATTPPAASDPAPGKPAAAPAADTALPLAIGGLGIAVVAIAAAVLIGRSRRRRKSGND
jgi:hypothetical protein